MPAIRHLSTSELEAGLDEIRRAPKDNGVLEMIVRRPQVGEREILPEGELDLSEQNLPPGSQLAIGTAIIEVTPVPHNGCAKFVERFGADAMKFVNSPVGKELHLRGINAKVVKPGVVQVNDSIRKI